jgi:hypothetical protein
MLGIRHFRRELRLVGVASLLYLCAEGTLLGRSLLHRTDFVEEPEQIERDVTTPGNPCTTVKYHEYAKHVPLLIGHCWGHYTNTTKTAATVTLHIFRGMQWISVEADAVTDGGPLAPLSWRVIRSKEVPYSDPWHT